ncbi:exportin-2 [Anaeramoeba flamelloides]|uniref:Exportin-2 n=1 Tax=Anaeramoeba flamelloides TaxID=1746091 RepID=A0ABQ8YZD0_9EUKA|nr:exportin-2 [Anaeramoeba flamelloides]
MENDFELLTEIFIEIQSGVTKRIKNAETELNRFSDEPYFYLLLIGYIENIKIESNYRQLAASFFTHFTIKNWYQTEEDGQISPSKLFNEEDQKEIRGKLLNLVLTTPRVIRNQLLEVLKKIAEIDFYEYWPGLMTQLTKKLDTDDLEVIRTIFSIMNMIFKNYRYYDCCNELLVEVKYALDSIQEKFVKMLEKLTLKHDTIKESNDPNKQSQYFGSLKLISKIFYSLSCHQLPAYFDDHLGYFCVMFERFAQYDNVQFKSQETESATELEKLQTAICENINLLLTKYSDGLFQMITTFFRLVLKLLLRLNLCPRYDKLAIAGIKTLTTFSKGEHRILFEGEGTLRGICQKVVIPNLYFGKCLQEMFEYEPREYIRQDIEGSEESTRRKASLGLVRSLNKYYEKTVTEIISEYISLMLEEYQKNKRENWKSKDAAIYLVIALTAKTKTQDSGATSSSGFIDIASFYNEHILPEITNNDCHPVLKADCLSYALTFRTLLDKKTTSDLLVHLANLYQSGSSVINTYSAVLIERILAIREPESTKQRFNKDDIIDGLEILLTNLFAIFNFEGQELNDYAMKAITRVIDVSGDYIINVSEPIIERLSGMVESICKNPTNPYFNLYVFEAFVAIIRSFKSQQVHFSLAEKHFLSAVKNCIDFKNNDIGQYAYTVLYQILEDKTQKDFEQSKELKEFYFDFLLPKVLDEESWKIKGNTPILTVMSQAYLSAIPKLLVESGHLENILKIVTSMLKTDVNESNSFKILDSIFLHIDIKGYQSYLPDMFLVIFERLYSKKSEGLICLFNVWLSKMIGKYGVILIIKSIDSIQKNSFSKILASIYLKHINEIKYPLHKKAIFVSLLRMLTDSDIMRNEIYSKFWPLILLEIIKIFENNCEHFSKIDTFDVNNLEISNDVLFPTEFSNFMFKQRVTVDSFPEFNDPEKSFVDLITKFIKENNNLNFVDLIRCRCPKQYDHIINFLKIHEIELN